MCQSCAFAAELGGEKTPGNGTFMKESRNFSAMSARDLPEAFSAGNATAPVFPPAASLDALVAAMHAELYRSGWCLRSTWRRRTWRHTSDGGFNPGDYRVAPISHRDAERFVRAHHYSASYPAARRRYGLISDNRLVGVAVLGVPMRDEVLTNALPTLDRNTAAELSRLVLLDEVPAPAESWFTARVFRDARDHGLRGVVAFSDPVPRPGVGMPGHVGIVYQALNADYCGRATGGGLLVLPDGTVLTRRALQKVRGGERGCAGVVRRLVEAGAPEPECGEPGKAYLRRALTAANHRWVRHPGNHRFVFRLGSARQRRGVPLGFASEPYPKTPDPVPVYR